MKLALRISTRGAVTVVATALLATVAPAGTARASHGGLDTTFDGDGRLTTFTHAIHGTDIAVLPDGRILAAAGGVPNLVLTRLLPDGRTDATFGLAGEVRVPSMSVAALLVQPDGKIVVAGTMSGENAFVLHRFLPEGAPDTGFGSAGRVTTPFLAGFDRFEVATLQPDGRIVAGGLVGAETPRFALVRYQANGALDSTFGTGGIVLGALGDNRMSAVEDMAVQPDGGILIVGGAGGPERVAAARFTAVGMLDASFDGDGVLLGHSGSASAVAVQSDGLIVVAGTTMLAERSHFLLLRLRADGAPDPGFDGDGAVTTDFHSDTGAGASAVAVRPNGRIVAAGSAGVEGGSRFAVASYERGGALDQSFDGDGKVITDMKGQPWALARSVGLDSKGRIVVGGITTSSRPSAGLAIARYLGASPPDQGYWLVASDGGVFSFGDAPFLGSTGGMVLNQPIVGMAAKPGGSGYWLVASDGGVFTFGDAVFHGSTSGQRLNRPIVGMASTASGLGYWLVASDGGVFSFGDAVFHGSTGDMQLVQPVVGMAAMTSGQGYWLVASDGGVFTFGTAKFWGSAGDVRLASPVVAMAADLDGTGYRLVAADGGVFTYRAGFFGSTGGSPLVSGIVGATASSSYDGYWLGAADGGVFAFGTHPFLGSTGGIRLAKPVVGIATRE